LLITELEKTFCLWKKYFVFVYVTKNALKLTYGNLGSLKTSRKLGLLLRDRIREEREGKSLKPNLFNGHSTFR